MVSSTCNHVVAFRHLPASPSSSSISEHFSEGLASMNSRFAIFEKHFKVSILHFSDLFEFKSIRQYWINLVCQSQISNGANRLDPIDHKYLNRMMNLKSNFRNTENSELHRYCQKEMLSLLHQFPFEYVTLKDKQDSDYNLKKALYEFCLCKPWYCCKFDWYCCNRFWKFVCLVFLRCNILLSHRISI